MKYIIDAYNLIGKLDSIHLKDTQKEQQCVEWMHRHRLSSKDQYHLIFDGHHQSFEFGSSHHYKDIMIIFTDITESADRYIIRHVSQLHSSEACIVTSDNRIIREAKKGKLRCLTSTEFILSCIEHSSADIDVKPANYDADYWLTRFKET